MRSLRAIFVRCVSVCCGRIESTTSKDRLPTDCITRILCSLSLWISQIGSFTLFSYTCKIWQKCALSGWFVRHVYWFFCNQLYTRYIGIYVYMYVYMHRDSKPTSTVDTSFSTMAARFSRLQCRLSAKWRASLEVTLNMPSVFWMNPLPSFALHLLPMLSTIPMTRPSDSRSRIACTVSLLLVLIQLVLTASSAWIWAHRLSIKGSKLLFPVIKATKIKSHLVLAVAITGETQFCQPITTRFELGGVVQR